MAASTARGVLVTGASTGIGRATALQLAAAGFHVFAGIRKPEDGEALERDASGTLEPVSLDITDAGHIEAAAERVEKAIESELSGAGLAGLVNNAGVAVPAPLEVQPINDFRRQLEVNLTGQLAVTQAFLPLLRKATGRLVFVSSVGGRVALPFTGAYHASQFGLEAIGDTLRRELRPWGIEVSLVEPGAVATPMWEKGERDADDVIAGFSEEATALYGKQIELYRPVVRKTAASGVEPERVAEAIVEAITAAKPKTRYVIGREAKIQARVARFVPDRLMDRLISREMGF
jgi:NAD(P)-dependent dehydrogenase (short-subunit alcohol dehydrogenase family)